jgi:hypothetical protein
MSSNLIVILALFALAAFAGFMFWNKKHKEVATEESHKIKPVGDKVFPNGDPPAEEVDIGPTLWDGPHSPGMPLHPTPHPSGIGWTFTFPKIGTGKVDYVEFNAGSLTGKTAIIIDYELTLGEGAGVYATPEPDKGDTSDPKGYRARMTTHFQEAGDDWSAAGKFEPYRWYFDTGTDLHYLEAGAHTIEAPLAGPGWGATQTSTFENNPTGFKEAIDKACAVGFVLGGDGIGIGHGAHSEGDAVLWVKSIRIV